MDLEQHFATLLEEPAPDLECSEQRWDLRADEVSHFSLPADDPALQKILQKHRLAGERVLDISFGAGRYLVEFARRYARVSGVELSARMLGHAQRKLQESGLQGQIDLLLHSPWEDIQLDALGWHQAFDLVFLHMSPAISSSIMLRKALAASRAGLFLCSHVHREDSLLGALQDALGLPRRAVGSTRADTLYNNFNLLYQWGYFPELTFEEHSKTSSYAPDHILQRYASWLWRDGVDDSRRLQLLALLKERAQNGKVSTCSRDILGHLYLDLRLRR